MRPSTTMAIDAAASRLDQAIELLRATRVTLEAAARVMDAEARRTREVSDDIEARIANLRRDANG